MKSAKASRVSMPSSPPGLKPAQNTGALPSSSTVMARWSCQWYEALCSMVFFASVLHSHSSASVLCPSQVFVKVFSKERSSLSHSSCGTWLAEGRKLILCKCQSGVYLVRKIKGTKIPCLNQYFKMVYVCLCLCGGLIVHSLSMHLNHDQLQKKGPHCGKFKGINTEPHPQPFSSSCNNFATTTPKQFPSHVA